MRTFMFSTGRFNVGSITELRVMDGRTCSTHLCEVRKA